MVVEEEEREIVESVCGESAGVFVSELYGLSPASLDVASEARVVVAPKFWSGGALFGEEELLWSRSGGELTWREKGPEPLTAKKHNFDLI
jgi:hypothetical protein